MGISAPGTQCPEGVARARGGARHYWGTAVVPVPDYAPESAAKGAKARTKKAGVEMEGNGKTEGNGKGEGPVGAGSE